MSELVNFHVDQYASFESTVFWRDDSGFPNLMNDFTAQMQLRQTYDDTLILTLTSEEDGGLTITAAEGRIDIEITPEQSKDFDFVNCKYDLIAIGPDDVVTRIIEGFFTLRKGVTHDVVVGP